MSARPAGFQRMIDALEAAYAAAVMPDQARGIADRVFAAAVYPGAKGNPAAEALPVTRFLSDALAPLALGGGALAGAAMALQESAGDLIWTTRKSIGPTASAGFAQAHANCLLLGPGGMEERADIWLGISLMAPGTRYPDHDHAPPEVYLALSPGQFWHGDREWISPGIGGTVFNRAGIRHAMRAGDAPFLAIWALLAKD